MTDLEWQTNTDPFLLLRWLPAGKWRRKRILLLCAAWRLLEDLLSERSRRALSSLEAIAEKAGTDGPNEVTWTSLEIEQAVWPRIWDEQGQLQPDWDATTPALAATILFGTAALDMGDGSVTAEAEAERVQDKVLHDGGPLPRVWTEHLARLAACVRDVIGNPLRPAPQLADRVRRWNGGTVVRRAQDIYDRRRFDRLPVLADALLQAGCDVAEILAHCCQPGPHARGCWVVDLVLGKE